MFAAVILLFLMVLTVALFEVSVNNRPRATKAHAPGEVTHREETAEDAHDFPKP
jgi:hypothetical protein